MRRRGRSRGGRSRLSLAVVLLVVVTALGPLPAVSSPVTDIGRSATVAVDGGEDALVGMNVSSALREDTTNCLLVVTNNRDRTVTTTVSLDADSQDEGDLVVPSGGTGNADEVTVDIAASDRQRFDMTIANNTSRTTVYFDVLATTADTSHTIPDRSSPITATADPNTCS